MWIILYKCCACINEYCLVLQPFQDDDMLSYVLLVFRAAMKMSNIDHCFDNMFTNPKDSQGVSLLKAAADVCYTEL